MEIQATAYLKSKKDQSIRRFHPWVFSGAVKKWEGEPVDGTMVAVRANKGGLLGYGYYQANSSICIRMLQFGEEEIQGDYWSTPLRQAFERRQKLGLTDNPNTNMYRLVFAEGDALPGLIIDVYNNHAVMQCYAFATYQISEAVAEVLQELYQNQLKSCYVKLPEHLKAQHSIENYYVFGNEAQIQAQEHGTQYQINWEEGQKTGFFIDQRENRKLLGSLSKGKKVLNTFCYTGGFSLEAIKGGATEVHSLDSSQTALDELQENLKLNGLEQSNHKTIKADATDYIKSMETDYDIIVLDPPAFAKSISARHKAIQGYKRLNSQAMEHIKPGGMIFTFSCSQVVDKYLFHNTILAAAINSGRKVKVLHQLHQPADHPYSIYHPEGEYLKGLVIQVM